ncbi:MAG: hypothetical protein RLY93_09940 [Sumerlaeia bacterium]
MLFSWIVLGSGLLVAPACRTSDPVESRVEDVTLALEPTAKIDSKEIDESSGLAASRAYPGVIWTHNDSGDDARIFAITRDGESVCPGGGNDCTGITVHGAVNRDWEDIALDSEGNLLIGDFGNNDNERERLRIYVVPEPNPAEAVDATATQVLKFHFPDQTAFPPPESEMNFDVEAIFETGGSIYVMTKHRGDTRTKLYRLPRRDTEDLQTVEFLASYPIEGMVTAADISADGRRLAVLTYQDVWLFESDTPGRWLETQAVCRYPIQMGQCEGITFLSDGRLLISNEGRDLYEVSLDLPSPASK